MYDLKFLPAIVYILEMGNLLLLWNWTAVLITLPHSLMTIIPLRHILHPKHLTKTLMLGGSQCLHQNICHHIIWPNKLEVDTSICNTFSDKMVLDVNMLCCSVVDQVPGEKVCSSIVNM